MTDDLIGKQLGGYEIIEQIGRGGMATVYRARQTSMNRTVALKILPRHHLRDDTYIQRFEREVKIVAQLEHRNIVPVYDYGEYDGQPFIAMRYMPAGSVDDILRKGPIDIDTTLKIILQVAPALDYAHTKSVLHRDLKPSNVLMDDDGGAYITDFGIARIVGTESQGATITTQGVVGTPSYMSPEQAQGHPLDGRSDVYSLGVMLFEMLTGRRPFENETPYSIAVMQVTTQPPNPRSINQNISGAVEQVILKSLKKKPENRYQSATQLAETLRIAIERPDSIHDTQPRPIPIYEPPQPVQTGGPMPSSPISPAPMLPYSTPGSQSSRPASIPSVHMRPQRRRRDTFWRNIFIGSLIGCGLLSLVIFGSLIALDGLLGADDVTPSVTTTVTVTRASDSAVPAVTTNPLDLTSEAARQNLLTPQPDAEATPFDPVGVRPQVNNDSEPPNTLLYFNNVDDDYSHLFLYDIESGEVTQLTDGDTINSYPLASPDGSQIVFQSRRDGDLEIYVMNLDTSDITQLTDNDVPDRLPSWSYDGEWIVYSSDVREDGNYDIYRVPAAGGEPELVFRNGLRNSHPRFSPDGRSIVFTSGQSADANTWEIILYEIASGQRKILTNNNVRDASPTFSPDGSQILYTTNSNGGYAIATIDTIGDSKPRILYETRAFIWGANYSPDGEFITFNAEEGRISTLYFMRSDGTDIREIEDEGGFYPSWVP